MKRIVAAIVAIAIAAPAYAQQYNSPGGWNSQTDDFGTTHTNCN